MRQATQTFIGFGLTLILVCACGSPTTSTNKKTTDVGGSETLCTEIAASSLVVHVNVPSGWDENQLMRELQVTGTLDKSAVSFPAPQAGSNGFDYTLYEQTGSFDVTVKLRSTSGSLPNFVVSKDSGGCHAVARTLNVDFAPPNRIVLTPGT